MTGLFLSEYVSRRDGWCIHKCLGKLYRTFSLELWLCSVLKWISKNSFYLIQTVVHLYWMLEWLAAVSIYSEVERTQHNTWACWSDVQEVSQGCVGLQEPCSTCWQSTGAYLWVSSITQCGWYLYNNREPEYVRDHLRMVGQTHADQTRCCC